MTTFATASDGTSKERRTRRLNEILWVMVAFLLLLTFFNIILWPMLRSEEFKKNVAKSESQSNEIMAADVQITKLVFTEDANGHILYKGKVIDRKDLKNIFGGNRNSEVEIMLTSRNVVAIFFECYRSHISPTIKLAPFGHSVN